MVEAGGGARGVWSRRRAGVRARARQRRYARSSMYNTIRQRYVSVRLILRYESLRVDECEQARCYGTRPPIVSERLPH